MTSQETAVREREVGRIHERIDKVFSGLAELTTAVNTSIAKCDICRPVVLGNGKESLPDRVTRLEERDVTRIRFLKTIVSIASIGAGLIGAFGSVALRYVLNLK